MTSDLKDKTQEIFMSAYGSSTMDEAFGKMNNLQFRMVTSDMDEENNLVPKGTSFSLLESWLQKCSLRSRAHNAASIRCSAMYNLLSIPALLFGGGAAGLAFWATSDENGTSHEVRVAVAGFSAVSTVFSSMTRLFRFSEREYQHKMASGMYSQLCRKIEVNVFSPSTENSVSGIQALLAEISVQFSNIVTFSPQIKV